MAPVTCYIGQYESPEPRTVVFDESIIMVKMEFKLIYIWFVKDEGLSDKINITYPIQNQAIYKNVQGVHKVHKGRC